MVLMILMALIGAVAPLATVTERQPLASPGEVAAYLQIPEMTLAQWRSRGKGPAYSRLGRHVRYVWTEVDRWCAEQESAAAG